MKRQVMTVFLKSRKPRTGESMFTLDLLEKPAEIRTYYCLNGDRIAVRDDVYITHYHGSGSINSHSVKLPHSIFPPLNEQLEYMQNLPLGGTTAWEQWCATMAPSVEFVNALREHVTAWRLPNKHELGFLIHACNLKSLMDSIEPKKIFDDGELSDMGLVRAKPDEELKQEAAHMVLEASKDQKPSGFDAEMVWLQRMWAAKQPWRDGCEICGGTRGGVPGNENRIDGKRMCDSCSIDHAREHGKLKTISSMSELIEEFGRSPEQRPQPVDGVSSFDPAKEFQPKNVPNQTVTVQSQLWQRQSGSRSIVPNVLPTTSSTTPVSKRKLNGG